MKWVDIEVVEWFMVPLSKNDASDMVFIKGALLNTPGLGSMIGGVFKVFDSIAADTSNAYAGVYTIADEESQRTADRIAIAAAASFPPFTLKPEYIPPAPYVRFDWQ